MTQPQPSKPKWSPVLPWAVVSVLLTLLLNTGLTLWVNEQSEHQHAQVEQQQERAGRALEIKLCTTFSKLSANKPPPGKAGVGSSPDNSRTYLQHQHEILAQIPADLKCPAKS